ncbi:rhodanese-like domain-containing protein [Desulfovibrio mangrovi]|uniref:rhodanese-like domain-containing protein n=1 Tax=Desulfovibrio mangrovi TaxID=2976983 RepID=UPI0022463904|nr:rhodanese-like domain-containing protein [Desulfovibrio mangrovi]UZP68530.1 rhodanese-like domain-containing protein [Desulfovibrio mangrovi]
MATVTKISPKAAYDMVQQGKAVLVDVRTTGEAVAERLPDSVYLPFDIVSRERVEGLGGAGKLPVMVCRSGIRAADAAAALAREVGEVAVLDGGMVAWKQEGLPVVLGRKAIPLERQVLVVAGTMVLLFTLLGLLASPYFFALPLFVGGGMVFAGLTGVCGMMRVLVMLPWNRVPLCGGGCPVKTEPEGRKQ